MKTFDIKEVGSGPVISAFFQQLGLKESINNTLTWDEEQWLLDPGTHVLALVIDILCHRAPLYRVEDFYAEQDVELLFGPRVKHDYFNDDVLGRVLDRIHAAGPKKVFSTVVLQARLRENLSHLILHGDTTARLVYGAYPEENGLNITRGYNKEHRTDLKQYKIGLVTNEDGFPLLGEVLDGNLDDKTWNKQLIENLSHHFTPQELKELIYVADSAVVTKANLELIKEQKLKFISRLPATFNLTRELINAAFTSGSWNELGQLSPGKKSAFYRTQGFTRELYGNDYRFVVVHSSKLDKRRLRGLKGRIKRKKKELEKAAQKLLKQTFACTLDAQDALDLFQRDNRNIFYPLTGTITKEKERVKRKKRGRPRKGEQIEYRDVYRVNIKVGALDQDVVQREKERLSCFVLITTLKEGYDDYFILKEYKEQAVVENRFKFIKHPLYIGPIYLQKKERLEALCYVIFIALALYIILQRRVRRALREETEPLLLPGKRKSFTPTGNMILELFRPVKILRLMEDDGVVKRYLPTQYNHLERVLQLIGLDIDIFTKPRGP